MWKKEIHFLEFFAMNIPLCLYISTKKLRICIITVSQTGNFIIYYIVYSCFSIIWPLFHYLSADISINEDYWEGYKKTNQIFADYICEFAEDGDMIWIHDYHLMLLPEMLRTAMEKLNKSVRIGFFLHIPFPTSEVFR